MLIIPAIDLRDGRCVRLSQGRKDTARVYEGDPVEIARSFEAAGAQMLHVVDLDGAFSESNSVNRRVLRDIVAAIAVPVQFGGGLRQVEDVSRVIDLGVTRVVIGTLAVESPETLKKLLRRFGSERIAVGIDAKVGRVVTSGWEKEEAIGAIEFAVQIASLGVARIVYTDVARDGMLTGPNVGTTCEIARASGLKVTASGGISSLADIERLATANCSVDSVIVGKALYEGRFTLKKAMESQSDRFLQRGIF
jgi:phosphoribosylformimino-5-aminoimidazole carboxamide ribotide isomerase